MLLFYIVLAIWTAGSDGVPQQCTSTTEAVCGSVPFPFNANLSNVSNCISCNTNGSVCDYPNPANNITCFRNTKSCQVCGYVSPDTLKFYTGDGYTLSLQPFCNVNSLCPQPLQLEQTIAFTRNTITLEKGNVIGNYTTIKSVCPVFVFNGVSSVTIKALEIICTDNALIDSTAPAIVFQKSSGYTINIRSLRIQETFLSGILIYGGNLDITPPISASSLDGKVNELITNSSIKNQLTSGFSAASFYCTDPLIFTDISEHSRFVVQPHVGPDGITKDFVFEGIGNNTVNLVNLSAYLDEFGSVYETQFYNEGAYSALDEDDAVFSRDVMLYQVAISFTLLSSLFILHQDVFYYFTVRNAIAN